MVPNVPEKCLDIFKQFKRLEHQGIPGVLRIESAKPGPILGITACTHGNEPSGLALFDHLLNEKNIEKELLCGTLYLAVNNLEATEKFFMAATEEEVRRSRYGDVNMNRLPEGTLHHADATQYEVKRARELYPIWQQFEIGLDIHSTLDQSEPMIISGGEGFPADIVHGFPIKTLISNIDRVQIGVPAFAFYGGLGSATKVVAIEVGQHTDPQSFERAAHCAVSLLQNLAMVSGSPPAVTREYAEYYIEDSLIFPDTSFDFIKDFKPFDPIMKGEVLAKNPEGIEIRALFTGHLIMPTSLRGAEKDITEEVAFISLPARIHQA